MYFLKSFTPKRLLGFAALLAVPLFVAQQASATLVNYSTSGVFTSTGTNVANSGNSSITFNGLIPTLVDASPTTNVSFGAFNVVSPDLTADTFNEDFTLTVTQTIPTAGGDSFGSADLSGNVTSLGSTLVVTFFDTDAQILPVLYELFNDQYSLNPPSSNGGVTTIQGTATVVPTPGAAMAGFALMGLVGLRRRRA